MRKFFATSIALIAAAVAVYFVVAKPLLSSSTIAPQKDASSSSETIMEASVADDQKTADCPGETDGPKFTVRVQYTVDNPDVAEAFAKSGAPANVRGWSKQTLLIRDEYSWERTEGLMWALDPNKRRDYGLAMREALIRMNEVAASDDPAALPPALEEYKRTIAALQEPTREAVPYDHIDVSTPGWTFSYDNVTKEGHKQLRPAADRSDRKAGWMSFMEHIGGSILSASLSATPKGSTTIAGYQCDQYYLKPWDTDYCLAEIDGEKILLYSKMGEDIDPKMAVMGHLMFKATTVEKDVCIPLSTFAIPSDVDFS